MPKVTRSPKKTTIDLSYDDIAKAWKENPSWFVPPITVAAQRAKELLKITPDICNAVRIEEIPQFGFRVIFFRDTEAVMS